MLTSKLLETLQADYEAKVNAYVSSYNGHKATRKELKELKKLSGAAIDKYNLALCDEQYRAWDAEGDAVKTAIRLRKVPNCVKVSFKVNDDTDVMSAIYSSIGIKANLPAMQKVIGAEKFHDPKWFSMVGKLAWLCAGRLNMELGDNRNFNYEIDDATRAFEFPNGVKPYDDAGVIAALQQVFDAILMVPGKDGKNIIDAATEYHENGAVFNRALTMIRESMTHQGNEVGTVAIGGTGKMSELVADAMHILLTSGSFGLYEDK